MKEVITQPQMSDMGNGDGIIADVAGYTLREVLDFCAKNSKDWGTVCIYKENEIIRKFDYDLHSDNIFYHHLAGWQYQKTVKEVTFNYCFMWKNIDIFLE
jgi:hypothetical protein